MVSRSTVSLLVLLLGLAAATANSADDLPTRRSVDEGEVVNAGGEWVTASDGVTRTSQHWNVDALRFKDSQIRGRISVSGSTLFDSANLEGQFSGRGVFGKLVDDEGNELASFEGAVTSAGASGTYRDRNGDVGEWAWEGQLKQSQP
jgi:hypothetical protein